MNLGIITTVHSGYGVFLKSWCASVAALNPPPAAVTVALGNNHGVTAKMLRRCRTLLPGLVTVRVNSTVLGILRNVAVEYTHTTWLMVLDVDDLIFPWAIEEFQQYDPAADVILLRWIERTEHGEIERQQLSPEEMAHRQQGRGFFNNSHPYRRSLWLRNQYPENDYPGIMFMVGLVEQGATFATTSRPCDVHVRRASSLSARMRDDEQTRYEAYRWRSIAAKRLSRYYGVGKWKSES